MTNDRPWIDTRLSQKAMDFLWGCISEENKEDHSSYLAGNISKSEILIDKDNLFFKSILKKLTERMFYRDWDNFSKYHIEVEEGVSLPEFELRSMWVNYQKQHEFNPIHDHGGLYSFVVFMKIPTHWKEQHALPISANSGAPLASDFAFIWSTEKDKKCFNENFQLSPEDEGRMLFFPAWLKHQVYPFYECEEKRITISGNIRMYKISVDEVEEKENMLEIMEKTVEKMKNELKEMKKWSEKVG